MFNEHKRVDHTGPQLPTIYLCDLCEKTCNTQAEFKKHVEDHHKPKKCNDCDYQCNGEAPLSAHRKKYHSNQFPCDRCGMKATSLQDLDIHIENAHKQNDVISCQFCSFKSKGNLNMDRHMNFRHNVKNDLQGRQQNMHGRQHNMQGRQQNMQEGRKGPYADEERRNNGFCRLWNNGICSFEFCKFLHEESPHCRYQERCRDPSSCRFFHQKPQSARRSFQYKEEDFPPFQSRNQNRRQ